jgi:hypothetical protein
MEEEAPVHEVAGPALPVEAGADTPGVEAEAHDEHSPVSKIFLGGLSWETDEGAVQAFFVGVFEFGFKGGQSAWRAACCRVCACAAQRERFGGGSAALPQRQRDGKAGCKICTSKLATMSPSGSNSWVALGGSAVPRPLPSSHHPRVPNPPPSPPLLSPLPPPSTDKLRDHFSKYGTLQEVVRCS